jgi:hypothetical protein
MRMLWRPEVDLLCCLLAVGRPLLNAKDRYLLIKNVRISVRTY